MHFPADCRPLSALLACTILAGCGRQAPTETAPLAADGAPASPPETSFLPAAAEGAENCGDAGHLRVDLFGTMAGPVRWSADVLRCEGMPRPDGAGARLRFAGPFGADEQPIAFIVAVPALERGAAGAELASNVTLFAEGQGRFFSTPDLEDCWTDVSSQTPLEADGTFSIEGQVYCIAPLPEVNGNGSVSIDEFAFSGVVDWNAS